MNSRIVPRKTDGFTQTVDSFPPLGGIEIETIRGAVFAVDAPGFVSMSLDHGDRISVALMVYDPPQAEGSTGAGMLVQFSANSARNLAASLLHLANMVDEGKVH